MAAAVMEALDFVSANVQSQCCALDYYVFLGLRISRQWVHHILKNEMVWGPALAMWVVERRPLKMQSRVMQGGWEISELLPCDGKPVDYYGHGNWYLSFLKDSLLQARVWQGGPRSAIPRSLPTSDSQAKMATDAVIEDHNKQVLATAFERISLVPNTPGCLLRLRDGTRPMYTWPQIFGQCYMQVSTDPHQFLAPEALGLTSQVGNNSQSWWVAMDGWYYILMSQVLGDGMYQQESIRWYKCGLNAATHDPSSLNAAVPDQGRALIPKKQFWDGARFNFSR